jgi:CspA family cold shock protein
LEGQVKWFDETKGFGFITPDDGQEDCFVHRSAVPGGKPLAEGGRVAFHIITDDKGRKAAAEVSRL